MRFFLFFDNHSPSKIAGPTLISPLEIMSKNVLKLKIWLLISSDSLASPETNFVLSGKETIPIY